MYRWLAAAAMTVSTSIPVAEADLLAASRTRLAELEARLGSFDDPAGRARLLLDVGRHDEARAEVPALLTGGFEARLQAAAILFAVHDYERLAPLVEALWTARGNEQGVRRIAYRWWFAVDDLARVERTVDDRTARGDADLVDRLARARLDVLVLEREAARDAYSAALAEAASDEERAWALHGLGVVLHQLLDFDASFDRLNEALRLTPLDADLLRGLAGTLIRLGRTDEAIAALELAVRLAPYHENAHYFLGNGYARKNYTQLRAAYPEAFSDENGAAAAVRRGSRAFAERRFLDARRHFVAALELCPEYGRAHNGLAKAIEAERMRYNVHRELYEKRFAERPMPEIAGIGKYVVNWESLEPRHKKQVALGVEPWARYVPVLLEAGSTHYIKPLHELLSESPEQDLLADQRISYDSRLWDDVRGVGGYHTVTGVEDVEQAMWNGYNTVLHELTHQVHQVLVAEDRRRIQDLYSATKKNDGETGEAFLSRYAGGSVWEYFAEGANSLATPRRDRFDTREIVRERLEEKDLPLLRLVRRLQDETDLDGAYTVALVSRGSDHQRRGRVEEAITAYRRAVERTPDDEDALGSLIHALGLAGHTAEALELAGRAAREQPESAALAGSYAHALWLEGRGLDAAVEALREARGRVREEERYLLDQQLGSWSWTLGEADAARRDYEAVLAYQADHPMGLWGSASAYALAGEWDEAWKRYQEAVRLRTGIVSLRAAYAHDLLRAGEHRRARAQLDAALLLDPDDPEVLALESRWFLDAGRVDEAASTAERAFGIAPWSDSAVVARAGAWIAAGRAEAGRDSLAELVRRIDAEKPPEYVYRPEKGSWTLVHTLPAVLREEIARLRADP